MSEVKDDLLRFIREAEKEEIALSVLSEIVMHRRGAGGCAMREKAAQKASERIVVQAAACESFDFRNLPDYY